MDRLDDGLDKRKLDEWLTRSPPENECEECGEKEECTEDCRCEYCREEAAARHEAIENDRD